MNETQLTDKQVNKIWELAKKMNLANLPKHGSYEDIRQNVFLRAIRASRQAFMDANAANFEEAAKCVLNSALADELAHLATNQCAFENAIVPFSYFDEVDEAGELVSAYEPADPKSTTVGYYPSQNEDWEEELFAIYEDVRTKVRNLPHDQRSLARGLMRGESYEQIGARLGVCRKTLYIKREGLKVAFISVWVKRCALRQARG